MDKINYLKEREQLFHKVFKYFMDHEDDRDFQLQYFSDSPYDAGYYTKEDIVGIFFHDEGSLWLEALPYELLSKEEAEFFHKHWHGELRPTSDLYSLIKHYSMHYFIKNIFRNKGGNV